MGLIISIWALILPVLFIGGTNSVVVMVTNCKKKFFVDEEDFYSEGRIEELPGVIGDMNGAKQIALDEIEGEGIVLNPIRKLRRCFLAQRPIWQRLILVFFCQ